jgi:hypothetical protein
VGNGAPFLPRDGRPFVDLRRSPTRRGNSSPSLSCCTNTSVDAPEISKSAAGLSIVRGYTIIAICLAGALAPLDAQALSIDCSPWEDHYFFDCQDRVCVPLFRAMSVRENACDWRFVIEPIEQWAAEALLTEAGRRKIEVEGVLQVSIHHLLASPELEDEHWSQLENSKMTTRQESPATARAEWEALVAKQLWEARKTKLIVGSLFMVILGILLVAGRLVWLGGFREKYGQTSLVGVAIGVQFLIAIACSIPAFVVYETGIGTMMPIAVLAPVAVIVVAIEVLALGTRRLRACVSRL